jgi:hypothetical protein
MSLKKSLFISLTLFCGILLMGFALGKDKDPLHKRIFNITIFEYKDGQAAKKGVSDKIEFKDGKLFSDYLYDKFQYKWIKYRINKDSIYTDSTDTEVRFLEVEGSATDDKNQTILINFNTVEWDIDGTIKITKNDKIKKQMDFVGREKGGKPKKEKKKKDEANKEGTEVKKD